MAKFDAQTAVLDSSFGESKVEPPLGGATSDLGAVALLPSSSGVAQGAAASEALNLYRALCERLGKTASFDDIRRAARAGECPSTGRYLAMFGSLRYLQEAAGVVPNAAPRRWQREDILVVLREEVAERGRGLTKAEILELARDGRVPYPHQFGGHFPEGFRGAMRELGYSSVHRVKWDRRSAISAFKSLRESLGRVPLTADILSASRSGKSPSLGWYLKTFGSLNLLRATAGMKMIAPSPEEREAVAQWRTAYSRGESPESPAHFYSATSRTRQSRSRAALLRDLKALGEELGRAPTSNDVLVASRAGRTASLATYTNVFGGLERARRILGYAPMRILKRGEVASDLVQLREELRREPTIAEVRSLVARGGCSVEEVVHHFGSIPEFFVQQEKERLLSQMREITARKPPALRSHIVGLDIYNGQERGWCDPPEVFERVFGSLRAAIEYFEAHCAESLTGVGCGLPPRGGRRGRQYGRARA